MLHCGVVTKKEVAEERGDKKSPNHPNALPQSQPDATYDFSSLEDAIFFLPFFLSFSLWAQHQSLLFLRKSTWYIIMAEVQRPPMQQEATQPRPIPQRSILQIPPPSAVTLPPPTSASRTRNSHLNLDTFSPVNQNGSFEFDRVLKSGYVQKRTRKTKVRSS